MAVEYWKSAALGDLPWLASGFTQRGGGVSEAPFASLNLGLHVGDDAEAVVENRRRVAAFLGFGIEAMVCAEQVHGGLCATVTAADAGHGATRLDDSLRGVDTLVTDVPGLLLTLFFADCVPVLLADPERRVIAVAHAGWRGLVAGVVENTIRQMVDDYDCSPETIVAAVGPCIGVDWFEVGAEVAAHFPDDTVVVAQRPHVSLEAATQRRLVACGVVPERIDLACQCTASLPDRYFSHRRDAGKTGRMAAVIGMPT